MKVSLKRTAAGDDYVGTDLVNVGDVLCLRAIDPRGRHKQANGA